ncbi:YybH family protein [Flagellimonas beolgyonensis]|uniref:YybH family protein n=1 Tax=Flagellimonas beolgyonensis TaxID=864064 RepID=UPI003D660CA4
MKNFKTISIATLFLSLLIQSCQTTTPEPLSGPEYSAAVKEIIDAKNAQVVAWYAAGEIDSAATVFAENSIQMPPNQPPLVGIEGYKAGWKQNVQFGKWEFDLKTTEVKASGDLATELGTYTLTFTPNETSPIPAMTDEGNYVVLWEKIDGDWKIVWDAPVSTVPMPMPEQPMDSVAME